MYAILDLESTGGKYNEEGITEIAIYKFDGQKIVDQFSCLINPERKIQTFVARLTGINNAMLRYAPKFREVAPRILEITEGCVIVAHNAKFDYRLLRTEFRRINQEFSRAHLCTVELSRKLIPDMPSYSLGKLVKRLGIPLTDRHRAIGDAQATVKLFKLLLSKDTQKDIVQEYIKNRSQAEVGNTLLALLNKLPTQTGVYYLHNKKGEVIYIGQSKNIKTKLNQYFSKDNPKARQIQQEVSEITFDLTGNLLFAQLIENAEIKKLKPKYNPLRKTHLFDYALYSHKDKNGFIRLKLRKAHPQKKAVATFVNINQGKKYLAKMADKFELCEKLTDLHRTSGACFAYALKKCHGACVGKEKPQSYNKRVNKFLKTQDLNRQNQLLIGPGRHPAEKGVLLIENGIFKGMAYYDLNHQIDNPHIIQHLLTPMENTPDARHIIQSYMRKENPFRIRQF